MQGDDGRSITYDNYNKVFLCELVQCYCFGTKTVFNNLSVCMSVSVCLSLSLSVSVSVSLCD